MSQPRRERQTGPAGICGSRQDTPGLICTGEGKCDTGICGSRQDTLICTGEGKCDTAALGFLLSALLPKKSWQAGDQKASNQAEGKREPEKTEAE